jgi:hypothetical protein
MDNLVFLEGRFFFFFFLKLSLMFEYFIFCRKLNLKHML